MTPFNCLSYASLNDRAILEGIFGYNKNEKTGRRRKRSSRAKKSKINKM
jgi:hypothetical protein